MSELRERLAALGSSDLELEAMLDAEIDEKLSYPWQRLVVDAYMAGPELLAERINAAERAIAKRLREQPDAFEHLALQGGLDMLRVLVWEMRPQRSEESRQDKRA